MKLKEFDYFLPKERIAQQPQTPRDQSRLLVLDRTSGKLEHKHFYQLADYLKAGEVLVLNNTKVMPARLIGKKAVSGGRMEVFLLRKTSFTPTTHTLLPHPHPLKPPSPPLSTANAGQAGGQGNLKGAASEIWQCLIGGHGRKEGLKIEFKSGLKGLVAKNNLDGTWQVKFNLSGKRFMKVIEKIGEPPLPPYIKRDSVALLQNDKSRYQTVYADEKKLGSVAAPTAGLHFTPALIKKLKDKGVRLEYVTLHVGLGTFAPVKTENIEEHKMRAEWFEVKKSTMMRLIKAKQAGRRVVAIGTTSARVLENMFNNVLLEGAPQSAGRPIESRSSSKAPRDSIAFSSRMTGSKGWTNIFIYPGYKFRVVDALITNFHLPKSTLLMLVSAFAQGKSKNKKDGLKKIKRAYRIAIKKGYRFYSYGDAMLIE